MASATWDDSAFQSALRSRLGRLEESSNAIPLKMTNDMADQARATVARRTGQTAASIESHSAGDGEAEVTAENTYLEFGTSKMSAQPFLRPAREQVISAYRSGRYKPEL